MIDINEIKSKIQGEVMTDEASLEKYSHDASLFEVLLALGMVAAYPFIRFRAAFGTGCLGLLLVAQDQPLVAMTVACGSLGLYLCTVFLSYLTVTAAAVLGLAGIGGFAYYMLT